MQSLLDLLHVGMRWSHIAAGFIGLLLFWIPVCTKKGSKLHILTGRVFLWLATFVSVTALVASGWGIVWPRSFLSWRVADMPTDRREAVLEARVDDVRFLMLILFFLAIAVLAGVVFGRSAVRTKLDHARLRSPLLLGLELAMGAAGLMLIGFGAKELWASGGAEQKYWIHIVLGGLGIFGAWSDLNYLLGPQPEERMSWLYKHVESMIGVGIGFHTAFAVFGFSRLLNYVEWELNGIWLLIPWVVPSIVGVPAAAIWIHRLRQQASTTPETGSPQEGEAFPSP